MDKSLDPVELKKKILLPHLDFVDKMLVKVKGTDLEEKWKIMHECITSDKKKPSFEKIMQMESTLLTLKSQSTQKFIVDNPSKRKQTLTATTSKAFPGANVSPALNSPVVPAERDPRRKAASDINTTKTIYRKDVQSESSQIKINTVQVKQSPSNHQDSSLRNNFYINKPFEFRPRENERRFSSGRGTFNFNRHHGARVSNDFNQKRKRSESPLNTGTKNYNMPKRSNSCYDDDNSERPQDSRSGTLMNSPTSSKFESEPDPTSNSGQQSSKTVSAKTLEENSSIQCGVQKSDPVEMSKTDDKKSKAHSSLKEAIQKVKTYKIPKLYCNKATKQYKKSTTLSNAISKMDSIHIPQLVSEKIVNEDEKTSESEAQPPKIHEKIENKEPEIQDLEVVEKIGIKEPEKQSAVVQIETKGNDIQPLEVLEKMETVENDDTIQAIKLETKEEFEDIPLNINASEINEASCSTKNAEKSKTASMLTSLLEDEEDNPEKILEGLMSVLGSEKLKKMQELLLAKTMGNSELIENKEPDSQSETTQKVSESNEELPNSITDVKQIEELTSKEFNNTDANESNSDSASKEEILHETPEKAPKENVKPSTPEKTISKESVTNLASSNSSPSKVQKKKSKKKMSELDRLHRDILTAHDCEGIMRACTQPRISIKPKTYEDRSSLVTKQPETDLSTATNLKTMPFSIDLIRLNLNADDMPIVINDEFYRNHLGMVPKKSKPGPKSKTVSYLKLPSNEAAITTVIKEEPKVSTIISEVFVDQQMDTPMEVIEPPILLLSKKPESLIKKKKKRKSLLWSKGILKKKPKRNFKLHRIAEWEDIESSDEEKSFDTVLKLSKFKDMFNEYALKCAFEKTGKKIIVKRFETSKTTKVILTKEKSWDEGKSDSKEDIQAGQPSSSSVVPTLSATTKQGFKIINLPKKINLPMPKNILTMISKSCTIPNSSSVKTDCVPPKEDNSPKISIKLPSLEKPNASNFPIIQRIESGNETVKRPIELKSNPSPIKPTAQNVVMVKPIAREQPENIKIKYLSANEQEALKAALSKSSPLPTVSSRNELVDKLVNTNPSLSINKIPVQKSIQQTVEKVVPPTNTTVQKSPVQKSIQQAVEKVMPPTNTTVQKSLPFISKVMSCNSNLTVKKTVQPAEVSSTSQAELIQDDSSTEPTYSDEDDSDDLTEIIPIEPQVEVVDLIDDDEEDEIIDILRPWVDKSEFKCKKNEIECIKMVNNTHCLASLFKCMGTTCGYFTNNKALFLTHLDLHKEHTSADSLNYLLCCYCNFRPNSINLLVMHIESAHGYAKFGCRYCFYRSVNEYQVTANHHVNYHRNKDKCVIFFEPKKFKNENTEKNYISETIPKVVPAFPCPYCRTGFYTITEFEKHVQNHKEKYTTICSKCDEPMHKEGILQHLMRCFSKFGKFQCVFCVFGTNIFADIDNHLSTQHPDKMSYFAERTLNHGKEPTSIEALTIKELSKKITGNVKKVLLNYSFGDEVFRNHGNAGRISDDLNFQHKIGENGVFIQPVKSNSVIPTGSDKKCSLQIGNVLSLHD